jgi:uncharacterized protein
MSHHHFRFFATLLPACTILFYADSSLAFDCAKASGKIESAICADEKLKRLDAELSAAYFRLLRETEKDKKAALLSSQRRWLEQRDKQCGLVAEPQRVACLKASMNERITHMGWEDLRPGQTLVIGSETVTVGEVTVDGEKSPALLYRGRALITASRNIDPSFTVLGRWRSPQVAAALITFESGGTWRCSDNYVIETRKKGDLRALELGDSCALGLMQYSVKTTEKGFSLEQLATPAAAGSLTSWDSLSGKINAVDTSYRPLVGTKMDELFLADPKDFRQPLANEEFFRAVNSIPGVDRSRFLKALWDFGGDCDYCDQAFDSEHYGRYVNQDLLSYSLCGWWMNGSFVLTGGDDALAVWQKSSGRFFWAIAPHHDEGRRDAGGDVHFYPKLKEWPEPALAELALWRSGAWWTDRERR